MSNAEPTLPDPTAADDLCGRRLGDFEILRSLGRGAMAEVYLAEQIRLKRRVALKILKPELAKDETYLKRFEREAQAAASLVHANIVQVYEVGHVAGLHYIAEEYVQGQNLRQWLARHGPPSLLRALSIMRQVAAALGRAAEHGVVHRDIKPENIMLTDSDEVKVADFGLARRACEIEADLTQVGMTMGTPLYMSPEQVEGRLLDHRSDLYSFGVTSYHMLTGSPPFVGDTALAVAVQHLRKDPQPLEDLRPDLPPSLCRTVHRLLAKRPEDRWESAGQVLRELCRVRLEHGGELSPGDFSDWESVGIQPLADPRIEATRRLGRVMRAAPRPASRGRRWLPLMAVVLAFVVGGCTAWFLLRSSSLTASHASAVRVARQSSPLRQWFYATQVGTEGAWQAVIEHFPEKEYLARRAKQQLARVYLRERDYDRALEIFEELSALNDGEAEFRAFGLAGEAGVLTLEGKYRESAAVLDELWPLRQELRDPQLRKMLDYVITKNRAKLGMQSPREWDQWLSEQFAPEGQRNP